MKPSVLEQGIIEDLKSFSGSVAYDNFVLRRDFSRLLKELNGSEAEQKRLKEIIANLEGRGHSAKQEVKRLTEQLKVATSTIQSIEKKTRAL